MKCSLLVVGKLKDAALESLCADYEGRIRHYVELTQQELKDDTALIRALPRSGKVVTLEVKGKALTSTQFSERLMSWGSQGNGLVTFVIGGAEGIPASVRQASDFELSLSSMTLPHRLARVLLLEQIYRGLSIWRGEPYARE